MEYVCVCVLGNTKTFDNFHIYLYNRGIYNGHQLCENFHYIRSKKNIHGGHVFGDIKMFDHFHICCPTEASIMGINFVTTSIA